MPDTDPHVVAAVTEPLRAWVEWSRVIAGVVAVAWRIQTGRPADLEDWRLLNAVLPAEADDMAAWTSRHDEDDARKPARRVDPSKQWFGVPAELIESIEELGDGRVRVRAWDPDTNRATTLVRRIGPSDRTASRRGQRRARNIDAAAPRSDAPLVNFETLRDPVSGAEVTVVSQGGDGRTIAYVPYHRLTKVERQALDAERSSSLLVTQKHMVTAVMDDLIRLGDLRVRFDWDDRPAARLSYGGGTLFGALVAQLTLTVGGVDALAVCDYCRTAWQPRTWPRASDGGNTHCTAHQGDKYKARLKRRTYAAGTLAVPGDILSRNH